MVMLSWKNFQPDDFKDKDSVPLSRDDRKRKTPDSGIHDTHKKFKLPEGLSSCGGFMRIAYVHVARMRSRRQSAGNTSATRACELFGLKYKQNLAAE